MADPKILTLKPSQFVERYLTLNGQPFSFVHYEFMRPIYDIAADTIVLKFSRQTGKSTTLANLMVARGAMFPYFKQLYISPTSDQTKEFSNARVAPVIDASPLIKRHYVNAKLPQNVFTKKLANGSVLYLRYALLSPDKLRGLSNDVCLWDEAQDQNEDNIMVVEQSMSRSLYKRSMYTGTPKRTKGTLANAWYNSTMNEWLPKCDHCGKWNFIDDKNIGLLGPICRYCGKALDTKVGQWVITGDRNSDSVGFRVNLLMFADAPWVRWKKDVINLRESATSEAQFFNEVLGLEYDDGIQPVTLADIKKCCTKAPNLKKKDITVNANPIALGIDYGPVNSKKSKTVLCTMQRRGDKYKILGLKKYAGHEADYFYIHQDVPKRFFEWGATLIGADAGLGDGPNAEIRGRLNDPTRLIPYRYSGTQKAKGRWNEAAQEYSIARTQVMTEFFGLIKKGKVEFPRWSEFEEFSNDILNIVIEYDKVQGSYKFTNDGPDDALHAMIFAFLSLKLIDNMELE